MIKMSELSDHQGQHVEWAVKLPGYADPEFIFVDDVAVEHAAALLPGDVLRIATEPGLVSERVYGTKSFLPGLGGVWEDPRSVPYYRTISGDTESFADRTTDWLVVNTDETSDRVMALDYPSRLFFGKSLRTETMPYAFSWAVFIGSVLCHGLNELAKDLPRKAQKEISRIVRPSRGRVLVDADIPDDIMQEMKQRMNRGGT